MLEVLKNEPLSLHTGFKIGGPTRYFIKPKNEEELISSIKFSKEKNLPFFLLGGGYNVLVSDDGFDGVVIHPELKNIDFKGDRVFAESGVSIDEIIDKTLSRGLVGLENFSGIPGSLGGALFINIHYYKSLISQYVRRVRTLNEEGERVIIRSGGGGWLYENSRIKKDGLIVVDAEFKLKKVSTKDKWKAIGRSEEIRRTRGYKYPSEPSVGSIFQNLDKDRFYGVASSSAAYYIDKLGLKGMSVGGASISKKHANMIINEGEAGAKDVVELAKEVKKRVKEEFGIELKPEIEFLGFEENPF